jgi:hypothetical protein
MRMPPLVRCLPALVASALLAAAPAHGEGRTVARMQVSAQVVMSCRFEASVPRIGAPDRASGTASFSVACTQAGTANAAPCTQDCASIPSDARRRTEYRAVENRDDGTLVATVLF